MISILMPSYNQNQFIAQAIDSVLADQAGDIELVIADGGSTDGTVDYLEKRSQEDNRIRLVSEPDKGPAQAINKAFARARGTLIGWLNSDDLYARGAVSRAVAYFDKHPDALIVYGQGEHISGSGERLGPYPTLPPSAGLIGFANGCYICQPTVFSRRSLWVMLGALDESLKTAFDYDYWLRAFSAMPERIGFIDEVQAYSRLHEACITQNQRRTVALEGIRLTHKYLGKAGTQWATSTLEHLAKEFGQQGQSANFPAEAGAFLAEISPYYDETILAPMRAQLAIYEGGAG